MLLFPGDPSRPSSTEPSGQQRRWRSLGSPPTDLQRTGLGISRDLTPPLSVPNVTSPPRSMWADRTGRKSPELTGEGFVVSWPEFGEEKGVSSKDTFPSQGMRSTQHHQSSSIRQRGLYCSLLRQERVYHLKLEYHQMKLYHQEYHQVLVYQLSSWPQESSGHQ